MGHRLRDLDELTAVLREHAEDCDREARVPVRVLSAFRSSRYLGFLVPTQYGGMGGDLRELRSVADELAGSCLSSALLWAMHCQQVDIIVRHATSALQREVLPQIAAGQIYLGSVTTGVATHGELSVAPDGLHDGAQSMSIDRFAPIVTGGQQADAFLITMGEDAGVSLIYARRSQLKIEPRGSWNPMGMRGTESIPLHLSGAVRYQDVIGDRGGFSVVAGDSLVPVGHVGWSSCWLGAARAAMSRLLRHLAEPSNLPPRDARSLVYERLARIRIDLELVSAYLSQTIDEIVQVRSDGERMDTPARQIHLNALKVAASELTFAAVDRMIGVAGMAGGYSRASPLGLERAFRDLRSASLNFANDRLLTISGTLGMVDRGVSLI